MDDYKKSIIINCNAEKCFDALTSKINLWWTERFEGDAEKLDSIFTVRFDNTFKTMKVIETIENKKIIWECIDSYLDLDTLINKSEWTGTKIEWNIKPSDSKINLQITHFGLNNNISCYDACEQGWEHFLTNSLVPFLETGIGSPYKT